MSTPATHIPLDPNATPPSTPAPLSPASPSVLDTGFRFPDNDPEIPAYLRGRTVKEALPTIRQMEQFIQTYTPPATQPQQPQQPTYSPSATPTPPNPDLLVTDPAEYQRQFMAFSDARVAQQLYQGASPLFKQTATLARMAASRDPEMSDIWSRYGHEIDMEIAGVPEYNRTVDLYAKAAEIVRGRHWRDFVSTEAQRLAAQPGGTLERGSSTPAPGTPTTPSDPIDALFAEADHPAVVKFRNTGVTANDVRNTYVNQMQLTPQAAADMIRNSRTLSASTPVSQERGDRTAFSR